MMKQARDTVVSDTLQWRRFEPHIAGVRGAQRGVANTKVGKERSDKRGDQRGRAAESSLAGLAVGWLRVKFGIGAELDEERRVALEALFRGCAGE